jgi:hypothetical protein
MTDNNIQIEDDQEEVEDLSGLAEIQDGFAEIDRLKNGGQPAEEINKEEPEEAPEEAEELEEELPEEDSNKVEVAPQEPKKQDKPWKLKKAKYRAIAEKNAALERVAELENQLKEASSAADHYYGNVVKTDIEKAKEYKEKAILEGDTAAMSNADVMLVEAVNKMERLKDWSNSSAQKQAPVNNEPARTGSSEIEQEMAMDWFESHPYLQPQSGQYNQELAQEVAQFVYYLDNNLANNGQQSAYFSEEYFDTIDKYIGDASNRMQPKGQNKAQKSKNVESSSHVGGVRSPYTSGSKKASSSAGRYKLTSDERKMCQNMGVTEKEWLKYKIEDLNQAGK